MLKPELEHSILDTILTRRSIRRYTTEPVPRVLLETILAAATYAPSAHNRQPWRFAVVEHAEAKETLARAMGARLRHDLEADHVPEEVIVKDTTRSYERLTNAPVLVAVCLSMEDMDTYSDTRRNQNEYLMAVQSTAMAGQNLLLAAHDSGLGACWMCAPLFCPDVVRAALNLPEDWQPQGIISMGYPAQSRESAREPLETRVLWR
jgi:coenzyme F420-0:L-glutamate ligase/coenzyme F420-1:gamma-L-glutamate ligase